MAYAVLFAGLVAPLHAEAPSADEPAPTPPKAVRPLIGPDGPTPEMWVSTENISIAAAKDPTNADVNTTRFVIPNERAWRIFRLNLDQTGVRNVRDWRGADFFEVDIFVEGEHALPSLSARGIDTTGDRMFDKRNLPDIPPGQWMTIAKPLRPGPGARQAFSEDIKRQQVEGMPSFALRTETALPESVAIHLKNPRLVSRYAARRSTALAALDAVLEINVGDASLRGKVAGVRGELSALPESLPDDRREHEGFIESLREIENRAIVALDEASLAVARAVSVGRIPREQGAKILALANLQTSQPAILRVAEAAHPPAEPSPDFDLLNAWLERRQRVDNQADAIRRDFDGADFVIGLPKWPSAWDDSPYEGPVGREISLSIARNETEAFQVIIMARDQKLEDVRLKPTDLKGPDGAVLSAENLTVAPMGWRRLMDRPHWLADAIRPDITSFDVAAGKHQPVWLDLRVPADAPSGTYKGKIDISAKDRRTETLSLEIEVLPITLPEKPVLYVTTDSMSQRRFDGDLDRILSTRKFLAAYGIDPWDCYQGTPRPADQIRAEVEAGARYAVLYNVTHRKERVTPWIVEGSNGRRVFSKEAKAFHLGRLAPALDDIQKNHPDLLKHVVVYGFDEVGPEDMNVMLDFYRELKERYPGVKTAFADYSYLWQTNPDGFKALLFEGLIDIYATTQRSLTREVRDRLQAAGIEVWTYQIYANEEDPVGCRVRMWSGAKDGVDGLFHWRLLRGSGYAGSTGIIWNDSPRITWNTSPTAQADPGTWPAWGRAWDATLWPDKERLDAGPMRRGPNDDDIATVPLAYWRTGLNDLAYLRVLEELRDKVAGADDASEHAGLLAKADKWIAIPDTITTATFGRESLAPGDEEGVGSVVVQEGQTRDMNVLLDARREIVDLILKLREVTPQ